MRRATESFMRNWSHPDVRPRKTCHQRGPSGDNATEIRSPSGSRRSSRREISPYSSRRRGSTPQSQLTSRTSSLFESNEDSDTTISSQNWRAQRPGGPEKEKEALKNVNCPVGPQILGSSPSHVAQGSRRRRLLSREPLVEDEQLTPCQSLNGSRSHFQQLSPHPPQRESSEVVSLEALDPLERRHRDLLAVKDEPEHSRASSRPAPFSLSRQPDVNLRDGSSRRRHRTSTVQSPASDGDFSRRHSSVLDTLLGPATGLRHHNFHKNDAKQAQCLICMDDLPSFKLAKLKCGHRMCNACLKRSFRLSVIDPQQMPPRCCADDIPIKYVDRLFDVKFKKTWNRKFAEFSTRNRLYCPSKRCGEWIRPEDTWRKHGGRRCGRCGKCKTKVCCSCKGKWHSSRDCPRDEETSRILEQAKEAGWQRCYRCKTMVELKEGCNHMTCRCGAEFCMICGCKWKTCECACFNYETPEDDRLEMQIPLRLDRAGLERLDSRHAAGSGGSRASYEPGLVPNAVRRRPLNYDDEMLLRRLQQRQPHHDEYLGPVGDLIGPGNASGYMVRYDAAGRPRWTGHDSAERRSAERFSASRQPRRTRHSLDTVAGAPSHSASGYTPSLSLPARQAPDITTTSTSMSTQPSSRPRPAQERLVYGRILPRGLQPSVAVPVVGSEIQVEKARREGAAQEEPRHRRLVSPAQPKPSVLAGLSGAGRGFGRVSEWRNHVEPGSLEAGEGMLGGERS